MSETGIPLAQNTITSANRDGSTRISRTKDNLLSKSSFLEMGRVSQKAVVPASASVCTNWQTMTICKIG